DPGCHQLGTFDEDGRWYLSRPIRVATPDAKVTLEVKFVDGRTKKDMGPIPYTLESGDRTLEAVGGRPLQLDPGQWTLRQSLQPYVPIIKILQVEAGENRTMTLPLLHPPPVPALIVADSVPRALRDGSLKLDSTPWDGSMLSVEPRTYNLNA